MPTPPTSRYALNTEYLPLNEGGTPYTGPEISRVHKILDAQTGGIVEALGTGILRDPDSTSLQLVAGAGLTATLKAGRAIARHSTYGGCVLVQPTNLNLTGLPANSTTYVFVAIHVTGGNDSRETGLPIIIFQDTDSLDGGELVGRIITGATTITSILDQRAFVSMGGAGGTTIHIVEDTPDDALGNDSDLAIKMIDGNVWRKEAGTWIYLGSFIGPPGVAGGALNPITAPWEIGQDFVEMDTLHHAGGAYFATAAHTAAAENEPGVDADWEDFWFRYAQDGLPGEDGEPGGDGEDGLPGDAGSIIYSGSGVPSDGTGINNDWYVRYNGDWYKKTAGSWNAPLFNLKGPLPSPGSQDDAEGGTENTKFLSSLRVHQAIDIRRGVTIDASAGGTIALTAKQAAADVIRVIGAPATDAILTIPDGLIASGLWKTIHTGGNSVSVRHVTPGGTSIDLEIGEILHLDYDGTNVFQRPAAADISIDLTPVGTRHLAPREWAAANFVFDNQTGAKTVTVPDGVVHSAWTLNKGAYALTIRPQGGTGVTIAAGSSKHIQSDGVNITESTAASPARATNEYTTDPLDDGEAGTSAVALGKAALVMRVETDVPAWVRLYVTPAFRTADAGRAVEDDPTPAGLHGVVLDVLTTEENLVIDLAPPAWITSMEAVPSENIACSITNMSGGTSLVTVTFTFLTLES